MSKPINPKFLGENGIHRVPLWRIGGFALNNTATNLYLMLLGYVSYYLLGRCGGHRFYSKRYVLDAVHLFFFWTCFPICMFIILI